MKTFALLAFVLLGCFACISGQEEHLPVVIWHGMGDSCCNPFSMGRIKNLIENHIPGIYVHSLMIGNNIIADMENGFLMSVNKQTDEACEKIMNDTELAGGYNALGFSQGGQFLRAVAQRCDTPRMNNLVTFGAQHQGVFGLPNCDPDNLICEEIRRLLDLGAYIPSIQGFLVQAQYWHDPLHEDEYKEKSQFLAEINNENFINQVYIENLNKLQNFVMVRFLQDTMVIPQQSEWFGFYTPGQDKEVLSLNQTTLYLEDRLGLKRMDEEGKLAFLTYDAGHLSFDDQWFLDEIVDKYL